SAPAPGLLAEPASILPVRAAAGPGIAGIVRSVPPGALVRGILAIARGELDLKLVELVPLSVGTLPLRYREQLLKALAGGNRLGPVHGRHYPIVAKNVPGGIKPVRDRVAPLRPSGVVLPGSFVRSLTAWHASW